jgi:hypothetical protein
MQNLKIVNLQTGKILIEGDAALLNKIQGQDLSSVNISDLQLDVQALMNQFNLAESNPGPVTVVDNVQSYGYLEAKRYAVLKAAYLAKFSK